MHTAHSASTHDGAWSLLPKDACSRCVWWGVGTKHSTGRGVPRGTFHMTTPPPPQEHIAAELDARKVFLQPGVDDQGRAILVVLARRHDGSTRDLAQTGRLIVYALDAAIAACDTTRNPLRRVVCLFDLSGLSINNLDVGGLRAVFETLQHHYPEHLGALYFINAPLIFWGLWKIVGPLVDVNTRQKLHFVSTASLVGMIPSSSLPEEYGGTGTLLPVDLALQQQQHRNSCSHNASDVDGGLDEQEGTTRGRWWALRRGMGRLGRAPVGPFRSLGQLLRRVSPSLPAAGNPDSQPKLLFKVASLQVAAALHPLLVRVIALARRMIQWTFGGGV